MKINNVKKIAGNLEDPERGFITCVINDESYSVIASSVGWKEALKAYRKEDWQSFIAACKPVEIVKTYVSHSSGLVTLKNGKVYYDNKEISGVVTDRIVEHARLNLPYEHLLKFVEKLYRNPSLRSLETLYSFMENHHLPINQNGNLVAYKSVRDDFYSVTSGSLNLLQGKVNSSGHVYNGIGQTVECVRNQVSDDPSVGCHKGLHVGSFEYASTFFKGGKIVLVELSPEDVVCVPFDCNFQKIRCCKYTVISEHSGKSKFTTAQVETPVYKVDPKTSRKRGPGGRFLKN